MYPTNDENPLPRNPHGRTLIALAGPTLLFVCAVLAAGALWLLLSQTWLAVVALICALMLAIFLLSLLVSWIGGVVKVRRIRDFLASDRPLLRWAYTPAEWRAIREAEWQEEKSDWRIQLGCLSALLGLAGLLTGALIGLDEGALEAVAGGLLGGALGAAVGGTIGGAIAGSNYLAGRWEYAQNEPGRVALAQDEVYANGDYFRGNMRNSGVQRAEMLPGSPPMLRIEILAPPRPRTSREQEWLVPIPARLRDDVERIAGQLGYDAELA
jgi:hypothetical protein